MVNAIVSPYILETWRKRGEVETTQNPEKNPTSGPPGIKTRRSGMENRGRREREVSIPETFSSFD